MPTRDDRHAATAERNRRQHRDDVRERRWFTLRVVLLCTLWFAIGLYLGGWAFHTHDEAMGHIYLTAGQLVTWVGIVGTLVWARNRRRDRGWD